MNCVKIKVYVFSFFIGLFVVGLMKSIELLYIIPRLNDGVVNGIPVHIALYFLSGIGISVMLGLIYYIIDAMIQGLQNSNKVNEK